MRSRKRDLGHLLTLPSIRPSSPKRVQHSLSLSIVMLVGDVVIIVNALRR